jgi:hypothetical protein
MPVLGWLLALAMLPAGPQSALGQAGASPRIGTAAIRGVVADATTSKPIADVQVTLIELDRASVTGADGRFEFGALPPGQYTLTLSRIGYIFVRRRVPVADVAIDLTIPLSEGTGTYRETVTVSGDATTPGEAGVASQQALGSAALQDLRVVVADDPMRAMQALPGVATGDDFQAEFSVRGSAFRHVGYVIDGTATPLLLHAVRGLEDSGSIAMVNTDVLSRASLLAGAHPRRHGDWLGATLEFDTRDGSRDRAAMRVSVSASSASTVAEGPLGPGKRGSWLFSIRRSYLDWLVRKIEPTIDDAIGFTDAQLKLVYDLGPRQQAQLLLIGGIAKYRQDRATGANQLFRATSMGGLASATWRYTGDRAVVTQRLSFVENDFDDRGSIDQELGRGVTHSLIWRGDIALALAHGWTIEGGARTDVQHTGTTLREFQSINGRLNERALLSFGPDTAIASGWTQLSRRSTAGGFSLGARATHDTLDGWTTGSPWLVGERTWRSLTVRGGVGGSAQMPDLDSRESAAAPLTPEHSVSVDAAIEHRLTPSIRWQIGGYRRRDTDVLRRTGEDRLVAGARRPETPFLQFATVLDGTARGVELVVERRAASGLTGWVGYAYGRTRYRDSTTGESFDGDFDQRHTLNVFVQQRLSFRTAVSMKLRVGSNFPLVGYFSGTMDDLRLGSERNRVRLPLYSRLDVRANRTFTFDRRRLTIFIELMNALDHENISQSDGAIRPTLQATGIAQKLIPRVPSLGMLIEF